MIKNIKTANIICIIFFLVCSLVWLTAQAEDVNLGLDINDGSGTPPPITPPPITPPPITPPIEQEEKNASSPIFIVATPKMWLERLFAKTTYPSCNLAAAPARIEVGQLSLLTWETKNSKAGFIDQGIGAVPLPSGSVQAEPKVSTSYTLVVNDGNGLYSHCGAVVEVGSTKENIVPNNNQNSNINDQKKILDNIVPWLSYIALVFLTSIIVLLGLLLRKTRKKQ